MIDNEQRYRASAYALLAALLRMPPDQAMLDQLQRLSPVSNNELDELGESMTELAEIARSARPDALEDEFNQLFIGLGRGELVPYGSWYLTGFLMEQPLSDLRDDLARLGFERGDDTREPEDHVAAIFEVFSVMINDAFSLDEQRRFFQNHMQPWLGKFFDDLGRARAADFYKSVARFGAAFIDLEQAYHAMRS